MKRYQKIKVIIKKYGKNNQEATEDKRTTALLGWDQPLQVGG